MKSFNKIVYFHLQHTKICADLIKQINDKRDDFCNIKIYNLLISFYWYWSYKNYLKLDTYTWYKLFIKILGTLLVFQGSRIIIF